MSNKYRVIVDGVPSLFSWTKEKKARQEAARVLDESPHARVRIRQPDILISARRPRSPLHPEGGRGLQGSTAE